jgi:hypothetical protein
VGEEREREPAHRARRVVGVDFGKRPAAERERGIEVAEAGARLTDANEEAAPPRGRQGGPRIVVEDSGEFRERGPEAIGCEIQIADALEGRNPLIDSLFEEAVPHVVNVARPDHDARSRLRRLPQHARLSSTRAVLLAVLFLPRTQRS